VLAFHGQHAFALGTVIALAESRPDIFSWRLAFSAGGDGGAPYLIETRQRRASGVPAASALPATGCLGAQAYARKQPRAWFTGHRKIRRRCEAARPKESRSTSTPCDIRGFHLLKFDSQCGCAADQRMLRFAEQVATAKVVAVADDEVAIAPRPRRVRIAPDQELPARRDRAARLAPHLAFVICHFRPRVDLR
jgi:hypothetical protein